jgi:hypothetical protein
MHPPAEPNAGPSGSGTVVLELGPGAGTLVLHTPPELNGTEINISLTGSTGQHGHRTHSMVRPRHVASGTRYAAVYPGLPPGEYTIWEQDGTPAVTVTVAEGAVTIADWPARRR